jgi:type IV pilus assembly protein PilA
VLCPQCGTSATDGDRFCRRCGRVLQVIAVAQAAPGMPTQNSGKATASLIFGLFFFLFPSAIAAIVLGHWSLSEIKHSAGRLAGQGRAIAGLVLGYLGIAAIPFILIVAAIAIPNLLRARISANESAAVSSIRTVNTAERAYKSDHPQEGYTCDLAAVLREYGNDPNLGSGQHGYMFTLQNCAADNPGEPNAKYQITAFPEKFNQTGTRAFCSDESGLIRSDARGSPQACLENGEPLQ